MALFIAALTFVLDRLHKQNHTACLDDTHAQYMPEVDIDQYEHLAQINTQTPEQFNSWLDRYSYVVGTMGRDLLIFNQLGMVCKVVIVSKCLF